MYKSNFPGRTRENRIRINFKNIVSKIPFFKGRLDAIWWILFVIAWGIFMLSWYTFVKTRPPEPVIQPIEDERILTNIRDDIRKNPPLLDAVMHSDGKIYISQKGSVVHNYAPDTKLWDREETGLAGILNDADITLLGSNCGVDPRSDLYGGCPQKNILWGTTQKGSLVYRDNGQWHIMIGDSLFTGADKKPVQHDQLTAAAVSKENEWLMLGTKKNGIGIYDLKNRRWLPLTEDHFKALPSLEVTHVVWSGEYFWIGGPNGLTAAKIENLTPVVTRVKHVSHRIIDLDVDFNGRLWVLEKGPCDKPDDLADTPDDTCLHAARLNKPDDTLQWIIYERNIYPDLDLKEFNFAQYWDNHLIIAGKEGLYSYDAQLHNWQKHLKKTIYAVLPIPSKHGFYFGYSDGLGLISQRYRPRENTASGYMTWQMPDTYKKERISKLHYREQDEVFALTRTGKLFTNKENPLKPVFYGERTGLNPSAFHSAFSFGDNVLFICKDGVLLHNIVNRTYTDLSLSKLPQWMRQPGVQLLGAGNFIYAAARSRQPNKTDIYRLNQTGQKNDPIDFLNSTRITDIPTPITPLRPWGENQACLISGQADGRVYYFSPKISGDFNVLTGEKINHLNFADVRDIAEYRNGLVVVDQNGLKHYGYLSRHWQSVRNPRRFDPMEVVCFNDQILVGGRNGELLTWSKGEEFQTFFGNRPGRGITIPANRLSDAAIMNGRLYLAGNGKINRYDLQRRGITARWELGPKGEVSLKGLIRKGQDDNISFDPLSLYNGTAVIGGRVLEESEGEVLSLSTDSHFIWTVRKKNNRKFLKGYPINAPFGAGAVCYFHSPSAGQNVTRIIDAVELPGGKIAVSTDAGLRFYNPDNRSWYKSNPNWLPLGGRLFNLGNHLLLAEGGTGSGNLKIIAHTSIKIPGDCGILPVPLKGKNIEVTSVCMDREGGRLAYIDKTGKVFQWKEGKISLVADNPGSVDTSAFRRLFVPKNDNPEYLLFTTDGSIQRYDTGKRRWSGISLGVKDKQERTFEDINITREQGDKREIVIAKSGTGEFFMTEFDPTATPLQGQKLTMKKMFELSTPFEYSSSDILDVQKRDPFTWTFVLKDRIKYYSPIERKWSYEAVIEGSNGNPQFYEFNNRGVVVENGGAIWWVARYTGHHPQNFSRYTINKEDQGTALDADGYIWRLDRDNRLLKIPWPYDDSSAAEDNVRESPFILEPGEVRHLFEWQNYHIFGTDGGIRFLDMADKEYRAEKFFDVDLSDFSEITEAVKDGNRLWLRTQSHQLVLLEQRTQGRTTTLETPQIFPGITHWVRDAGKQHWAYFPGEGWKYWNREDSFFSYAPVPSGSRLYVIEGQRELMAAALNDDGIPYYWNRIEMAPGDMRLPAVFTRTSVTTLLCGGQRDWWAIVGRYLYHIVSEQCPNPDYVPPPQNQADPDQDTRKNKIDIDDIDNRETKNVEPPTIPCYKVAGKIELPEAFDSQTQIVFCHRDPIENTLEIRDPNGLTVIIQAEKIGRYEVVESKEQSTSLPGRLVDLWDSYRVRVRRLRNSSYAYDPIQSIYADSNKRLMGRRPGSTKQLAEIGTTRIDNLPPALDTGWLKWKRASRHFQINIPGGSVSLTPDEMIKDSTFIFEPVEAILPTTFQKKRMYIAANKSGVWVYWDKNLDLSKNNIIYYNPGWQSPVQVAHNRFLSGNRQYKIDDISTPEPIRDNIIRFGDVTITEKIRERSIQAEVLIDGQNQNAFDDSARGFRWDLDKKGAAYTGEELYVQSAAGLHPVDRFTGFQSLPGNNGVIHSEDIDQLYFDNNNIMYQYTGPAKWLPLNQDPRNTRELVNNHTWIWRLKNGNFSISFKGARIKTTLVAGNDGYGFPFDRLRDAVAYQDILYVMTDQFFEAANSSTRQLSGFKGSRLKPGAGGDRLIHIRDAQGVDELLLKKGGNYFTWNHPPLKPGFTPITRKNKAHPGSTRHIVNYPAVTPVLRITREPGKINMLLKVKYIDNSETWVPFKITSNGFPFDKVTSMAVKNNSLYIGTKAGLQVYGYNSDTSLKNMQNVTPLDQDSQKSLKEVRKVGIPFSRQDIIVARFPRNSITTSDAKNFTNTGGQSILNNRLRVKSKFWYFHDDMGTVKGRYNDQNNRYSSGNVRIENGRFPHDRLKDIAIYERKVFTLWRSGNITLHPDLSLHINDDVTIYNLDDPDELPVRLIYVPQKVRLRKEEIQPGVYYEGRRNTIWRYIHPSWQKITDNELRKDIINYADNPPILSRGNFRLLTPKKGARYVFQHRPPEGEWRNIRWLSNCVGIDKWSEFIFMDNRLWAATPAGLTRFSYSPGSQVTLDTNTVIIIPVPRGKKKTLTITELRQSENKKVLVRCNSSSQNVYEGDLSAPGDENAYNRLNRDPFKQETLVVKEGDRPWNWRMENREGRNQGNLVGEIHNEDIQLISGRFKFDTLDSIAFFKENQVETGTESGGWYSSSNESLHVKNLRRPALKNVNPAKVIRLDISGQVEEKYLALKISDKKYILLKKDGVKIETTEFLSHQGHDGFWSYDRKGDVLVVTTAKSIGGVVQRYLKTGRFTDDHAMGLPVTGADNGKTYHMLLTGAGIVSLNHDLLPEKMYLVPPDLLRHEGMRALFMYDSHTPLYFHRNTFYEVTRSYKPFTPINTFDKAQVPGDAKILAIEDRVHDFIRIRWEKGKKRGWWLMRRRNATRLSENLMNVRIKHDNPKRWVQVYLSSDNMEIYPFFYSDSGYTHPFPEDIHILAPIPLKNRLLLIGQVKLWEVNIPSLRRAFKMSRDQVQDAAK
jgi:ligand-binding sensor domain-containing protein